MTRPESSHQPPNTLVHPSVIEQILGEKSEPFRNLYEGWNNDFEKKYALAKALIEDGRFENPEWLLENFITKRVDIPQKYIDTVGPLRDRLHFLLIQKGTLSPDSMQAETAERIVSGEAKRREDLQDLIADGWPIEVVGQIMTIDLFSDITDEQKLQERYSFVARSMIRDYIGVLSGKRKKVDLPIVDLLDRIPAQVFSNPSKIKFGLIEAFIEERLRQSVTDAGVSEGIATIETLIDNCHEEEKKKFLQNVYERFMEITTTPINDMIKDTITVKGKDVPFPSFEQRTFAYDFIHNNTRLLSAEAGLGKTNAVILAMEQAFALKYPDLNRRVLVIGPAGSRETWEEEDNKTHKKGGNVFVITSTKDIEKALQSDSRYIHVSFELLGLKNDNPEILLKLKELVTAHAIPAVVIDEIHNISNVENPTSAAVEDLVKTVRETFVKQTGKKAHEAPVIGMTATPIKSSLTDMDSTMGLLYPDRYAMSAQVATRRKTTFSEKYLRKPELAYLSLTGNKEIMRWERAKGVDPFEYKEVSVAVSPFEEYLYNFIANELPTGTFDKIRLLENVLFNPLLVKAEVREKIEDIPEFDLDTDVKKILSQIARIAKQWDRIAKPGEPMTADTLVQFGMGEEVLACFFSELLENGIDTLVDDWTKGTTDPDLRLLRTLWKSKEVSSKYVEIREMLKEALTWKIDENGQRVRRKVMIVSPEYKQGRTRDVKNREITVDGTRKNLHPDYELETINETTLAKMVPQWVEGLVGQGGVLIIDGDPDAALGPKRNAIIKQWTQNPEAAVMLVMLKSAWQSRDYTLDVLEDDQGNRINGVLKIFINPTWNYPELLQMGRRSLRQGQKVPVEVNVLESEGMLDEGRSDRVIYSYLLSRLLFSGVSLDAKQMKFLQDNNERNPHISLQSPESRFLGTALALVQGAGEDNLTADIFLRRADFGENKTYAQLIAEKFFDKGKDAYHASGYNAELVSYLIRKFVKSDAAITSIGAGTLLLQRKLQHGITNIDINPYMIDAGWDEAQEFGGKKIVARASQLPEDEIPPASQDIIDLAFTLHWSSLSSVDGGDMSASERVKILSEIHKALKQGGKLILTSPQTSFDSDSFERFSDMLEKHFGFTIHKDYSGRTYGRSEVGIAKRIGWSIVAEKIGDISLAGLTEEDLKFTGESDYWTSPASKRKKLKVIDSFHGREIPDPATALEFDQYEIRDSRDQRSPVVITRRDEVLPLEDSEIVDEAERLSLNENILEGEDINGIDFLRGPLDAHFVKYKTRLVKPLIRASGMTQREVEQLCLGIFLDIQREHGKITSRTQAFSAIKAEFVRRLDEEQGLLYE